MTAPSDAGLASWAAKRRRALGIAAEVALLVAALFLVQRWQSRDVPRGIAPAIDGIGLDGEPLSLAALGGKPALVHFWATWCGVCRAEEGTIAGLARDTPMITVATSSGDARAVKAFLDERGVRLPVLVDPDGAIAARWGVHAFPTSVVVDGKGEISGAVVGYTTRLGLLARLWWAR